MSRYAVLGAIPMMAVVAAAVLAPSFYDTIGMPFTEAHAQTPQLAEIKIGALLEYSSSYDDTDALRAIELSIQDINNDPAVSSEYQITLVPLDITDHVISGNPAAIAGVVQQAVQTQGITHFVGYSSSTIVPAKQVLDNIPGSVIMGYGSSAPVAPLPDGTLLDLVAPGDSLFRLVPSDLDQAASVTELVLETDGKTKGVIVIRESWLPILQFLIPEDARSAFTDLVSYGDVELFADQSAAVSAHQEVARMVDETVGGLVASEGADNVAVIFVGYPLDFEYHIKGVLAEGSSIENLRDVKWYSTSTITGEAASVRDADVAAFAASVDLTGTRYTVLDNDVNADLCARLMQMGSVCDQYEYHTFAAYDAVHLLVDAIITQNLLASDDITGNERLARDLIFEVASGHGVHHLVYEGRTIGDGALGEYTLNAAGDLDEPSTYTILTATTDPASPWEPAAEAPAQIQIGALLEYSPSYDDTDALRALELSIQDINNDPAVGSVYQTNLVPFDVTDHVVSGNLAAIAGVVQQAVQTQGITHFVGYSSSTIVPAKQVLDNIPGAAVITYGTSVPVAPLPDGTLLDLTVAGDSLFKLVPSDLHQVASVTDLILEKDGKTRGVVVVRESWIPVVQFLLPDNARGAFADIIPYGDPERFADQSAAVSAHQGVARMVDEAVGGLVASEGADNVAVIFLGFPLDFEYHAKGVLAEGSSIENLRDVKWYSTSTITGEAASVRDADVAAFAASVDLTGTRYTVLDNDVNADLCARLVQMGSVCNPYEYHPFAAYDAVHLLVDAVITQNELASDDITGNERLARDLIVDVASGQGVHHLAHEGRTIGDGALGAYTLDAAGDLEAPSTYTVLMSTTDPASPWEPLRSKVCR